MTTPRAAAETETERDARLLAESEALDRCYAEAADFDARQVQPVSDDDRAEAETAVEQSLDYFNRYIAGDR